MSARISVVVISRNEGAEVRRTVENLEDTLPATGEIVIIDDGSTDRSCDVFRRRRGRVRLIRTAALGVARARNHGGRQAKGDVLIFADAHIRMDEGWWRPLVEQLEDPLVGAVAPAITKLPETPERRYGLTFRGPAMEVRWLRPQPEGPAPAPILPGCCLAMRRDVFERPGGGWDGGMLQRGNIDNEISVRLWSLGYELRIVPEVLVRHRFRLVSPYEVDYAHYVHNRLRLAFVHFNALRLGRVVSCLRRFPQYGEALALIASGDIAAQRALIRSVRVRDDDWFFYRFQLNW